MLTAARSEGQLSRPLRDFAGTSYDIWPSRVGFIAVDDLVQSAPGGVLSMRTFCEEVAGGASTPEAFNTAFGAGLDDFYKQFEEFRQQSN